MNASTPAGSLLIGELLRRNADVVPDAVAASLGDSDLSHGALDALGNRCARSLRRLGVGRGDRVLVWADTALEVLPVFAACAKLGAAFAPVNARLGPAEAREVAALARPTLVVVDDARIGEAGRVAGDARLAGLAAAPAGGVSFAADALDPDDAPVAEPELAESDPHVIFFTSGSTGPPKGVVLSHRANYLRSFQGVFRDRPERSVCMFPLFHMAAFTLALSAWQTRGEIAFVREASAEALLRAVERRRANRLYCIPLVWRRILEEPADRFDLSSLRELDTGTQAVPIELVRALKQRFPDTVTRIYYGSTEAGSGASLDDADVLRKPGSVGRAPPGVDLALAPDGEILLRSAYLADGYFDAPEATAAAFRDGWYHTGDLGELDEDGYLHVVGRARDVIRSGGESVAPAEVEAVLAGHPGVVDVAVVGLPDPDWGEVVCAVVVAADGPAPDLAALHGFCEGRLAGFKRPRRLARSDAIPRTAATDQVQRPLLVEQLLGGEIPIVERRR